MMIRWLLPFLLLTNQGFSQSMPAATVLDRSIAYHDPEDSWGKETLELLLTETRPGGSDRQSKVTVNLFREFFKLEQTRGDDLLTFQHEKGVCTHSLNGRTNLSQTEINQHRLTCERTETLRNYYTYLWGLPMKLKDPGTILAENAETSTFNGKECWKIKVTYSAEVGSDVWYFYFDQDSFALSGYRFYHDEAKNDGEYIVLKGEEKAGSLRLPKIREWYTHGEDKLLGTDILNP